MNLIAVDLFLKSTDGKTGAVTYTAHRAFDAKMLVESRHAIAVKDGGSVVAISEAEFQKHK